MILAGQLRSHLESSSPKIGFLARALTVSETTTKFCPVIKLHVTKISTLSTLTDDVRSVCGS